MKNFQYTPDDDIKVHEEGAIRLICAPFQSHENGLPEWLKNSADAYVREDASLDRRVIVVILNGPRQNRPASISCLDFGGMSSDVIESSFRIWADPDAAKQGMEAVIVQGGHGNGGKCYMTQMFDQYAFITTVKRGRGNRYGVASHSVKFGYIPDRATGRDFQVPDMQAELGQLILDLNSPLERLPKAVQNALLEADGFSIVTGVAPKGYVKRIPSKQVLENLEEHTQMIRTLELCKVFVVSDGQVLNEGQPLALPSIPSMPHEEIPRRIPIPGVLKDPSTEEKVSTTADGTLPSGTLTIRTSDVSMRWKRKGRHNIAYYTDGGYIGFIPVSELDVQSPRRDNLYGQCHLQSLAPFKQNERRRLAAAPLTRAVEAFISREVQEYAKELEARDRQKYGQEEKNALSKMNEALDRWKNRFLEEYMRGLWGPGAGNPPTPPPPLPSGKPSRLEVGLSHNLAGLGVSFRPSIRFFDAEGRHIRPTPYRWVSEDTNIATIDEDISVVNTHAAGTTTLYAETLDGKLMSNRLPLEVVLVDSIDIIPTRLELPQGSRHSLEAVCTLRKGQITSDIYLVWTEADPTIARVSSAGLVFGFAQGETQVAAGDDRCISKIPSTVIVTTAQGKGPGKAKGRGFPIVLVSGEIDPDPDTKEYVHFSVEDPPIWQRPQDVDRNIWWINSAAPLARMFLPKERGYGYDSREWRMYHLERYIEVIVQIAITNGPLEAASMSSNEWIMQWGERVAEIQAAAASDLSDFISLGTLPPE